jgi:hypothetical protein
MSDRVTTEESRRLWRLICLAIIQIFKDGNPRGITTNAIQRGCPILGDSVVYAAVKALEADGLIVGRDAPSGHPSGSRVTRWHPADGVSVSADI